MRRFIAGLATATVLALPIAASAQSKDAPLAVQPPPSYVAAPSASGNPYPTADLLIDALSAVERAQVANPIAAVTAEASYSTAMARYRAHDSAGARAAAAEAIREANVPSLPNAGVADPVPAIEPQPAAAAFTWTDLPTMDAEAYLGIAQDAFTHCLATGTVLTGAQQSLAAAQADLAAHKPFAAHADALLTINACANP